MPVLTHYRALEKSSLFKNEHISFLYAIEKEAKLLISLSRFNPLVIMLTQVDPKSFRVLAFEDKKRFTHLCLVSHNKR